MSIFGTTGPPRTEGFSSLGASFWTRIRTLWGGVSVTRRKRSLRLCESLSLGEKRLLALVECEGQRLLLSVTGERIGLIERLGEGPETPRNSSPERDTQTEEEIPEQISEPAGARR